MTTPIQPALDGSIPAPKIPAARRRVEDFETWVEEVRPKFVEIAKTGSPFLCWKVARQHELPDPPDRDHDWGRFMAGLHRDGLVRTDGFGLTRDKSGVRRWRGTRAAIEGRAA
ncbi:hypothetical protein AB0M68_03845 [Streptomyces sp. NPDC051453]|uniref:hypothetical protein n=1 Tax=Streptomyces sp. NPDC051453 TaxID=3154941 RepID=UPI00342BF983